MTALSLHIPNVFEHHQVGDAPSQRLLVVFSAANASSFTFFRSTEELRPDRLHIRDPDGNAWYQNGLAEGETLHDIEARIAEVAKNYREVWMVGSSMGGYAALYFGTRLQAQRVLAIAPQILVDSRFSRGPRAGVKVHTPDIAAQVRAATRTQCTIVFGSFDLIDTYNIAHLYEGDHMPLHIRVLQYEGQDHMLPVRLEDECTLKRYFQQILVKTTVPQLSIPYREGRPLDDTRLAVLRRYIGYMLKKDFVSAYADLKDDCMAFPDWHALHYYWLLSGFRAGVPPRNLKASACALSDLNPGAIDFAFLAAQCCEGSGDVEGTYGYLDRVFGIRRSHPPGRKMLERLPPRPERIEEAADERE